jgi:hypothetical protein
VPTTSRESKILVTTKFDTAHDRTVPKASGPLSGRFSRKHAPNLVLDRSRVAINGRLGRPTTSEYLRPRLPFHLAGNRKQDDQILSRVDVRVAVKEALEQVQ